MIIRKECLGLAYSKKSPWNSCYFSGVITDNPEDFELYKVLQLDVFEKNIPPIAVVTHNDDPTKDIELEIIVAKPKKKKRDTSEGNE